MKKIILIISLMFVLNISLYHTTFALEKGQISICFENESLGKVNGVKVDLYKVANYDLNSSQSFTFTDDFKDSEISIVSSLDIDEEDQTSKCLTYIEKKNIQETCTQFSNDQGMVNLKGLDQGLYFLVQSYDHPSLKMEAVPLWILLPMDNNDGTLNYYVKVNPKFRMMSLINDNQYSVYKIWKDNNDEKKLRPQSIQVGLYGDGQLKDVVTLNALNNWFYSWENTDYSMNWEVKEIDVDENYHSQIKKDDHTFVIENQLKEEKHIENNQSTTINKIINYIKTSDNQKIDIYIIFGLLSFILLIILRKNNK